MSDREGMNGSGQHRCVWCGRRWEQDANIYDECGDCYREHQRLREGTVGYQMEALNRELAVLYTEGNLFVRFRARRRLKQLDALRTRMADERDAVIARHFTEEAE